jgi:hypothetical protein
MKSILPFSLSPTTLILSISALLGIIAIIYSYSHGYILAYGDAESHLNIAKRVVDSITPGFSQLGGIWLPLQHVLLIPLVTFDPLWRTGLAGSIISWASYVISAVFLYKLIFLLTKKESAGILGSLAFCLNFNILYMQSTPMTELPLIAFFTLSTYFFIKFLNDTNTLLNLILAALFGFFASLTRYDGWFLVGIEAFILGILYVTNIFNAQDRKKFEGLLIMFTTLAFWGIVLWIGWDYLILGDPLYFSNSPFSAKSQQQGWLARGELPSYHNLTTSILYYAYTSYANIGTIVSGLSIVGLVAFLIKNNKLYAALISILLLTPFFFYVITLYVGQSIIFIPQLTPANFEWNLFNVRYGIMMVPIAAIYVAFLYTYAHRLVKPIIILLVCTQVGLFINGPDSTITLQDGISGLSHAKKPDVEQWLARNYDGGTLLLDDYARTVSIIRSNLPMEEVIYIGNKPYWDNALKNPESNVTWIVMQKNDVVWKTIYEDPAAQANLYKYFVKAYTSPDVLVFKRNPQILAKE